MREPRAEVTHHALRGWLLEITDGCHDPARWDVWPLAAENRDDAHAEALRLLRGWASLVEIAWKAPPDTHHSTVETTRDIIGSSEREPKEDE